MASNETPPCDVFPVVMAIDPGIAKCGVAVVCQSGDVHFREVVASDQLLSRTRLLLDAHRPEALIVGGGTGSRRLIQTLRSAGLPVRIEIVDEAHTSEEARARFLRENSVRGWQRILPCCLRTPWCAYDDYVAVILGERYWQGAYHANKRT